MTRKISTAVLLTLFLFCLFTVPVTALDKKAEVGEQKVVFKHNFPTHMTIEEATEYEQLVGDKVAFSEAVGLEEAFLPGSSALQSALVGPSGLFGGIFAGNTTYDYQHNGTCHRMIQTGRRGDGQIYVHVSWMVLKVDILADPSRQVNYNCYDWNKSGGPDWTLGVDDYGGISIVTAEPPERGGYTHTDANKDGKAVVYHHSAVEGASSFGYCVRFAIPGMGTYVRDRLISLSGQENIWPSGDIGYDTTTVPPLARHVDNEVIHVVAQDSGPGAGDPAVQAYWRYVYVDDPGEFIWQGPASMDSSMTLCHTVFANDTRVIVAFGKPREYAVGRNQYDNDLVYYESNLAGADWIVQGGPDYYTYDTVSTEPLDIDTTYVNWENGAGWNATDYKDADEHRFYIDMTGGFTSDGLLHLVYNNPGYDDEAGTISVGPTELLHWYETTAGSNAPAVVSPGPDAGFNSANFHTVSRALWGADGTDGNDGSSGAWNRYISKICLAFGDGSTECGTSLESNLDYLYMTYCQDGSLDALDKADASAAGMQNSNVWLSISNDKGYSWAANKCITTTDGSVGGTPTRTPGCDPETGDTCNSEDWNSCAEIVNDTLHVFFVGDLDAGGIAQGEGSWRLNDMMYLPIIGGGDPNPLCPTIAPVLGAIVSSDLECEYYSDLDEPVNTERMDIDNFGNATLTYSVTLGYAIGSGWLSFKDLGEEIDETTIAKGGETDTFTVEMDGSALANGLYLADIEVTHDDPTKSDPYVMPIQFFRADSFICSETVTMTTPCVVLDVTNTERWGLAGGEGMRYYKEPDDDSLFNPFYDASLAIKNKTKTAIGPDTIVYRNIFGNPTPSNPGFRALEHPKVYYNAASNDSVVAANQVTVDSTIGVSVRYLFPQEPENCEFVRIKFKVYPMDDQTQDLVVGAVADIDCPGGAANGIGSENFGGCVENYNLVYLHGTDTTRNGDFTRETNRFVAGMTALTCNSVKRMWVGDNPLYVYPDGGFEDPYIFTQMDLNGCEIWADSAEDLHVIMAVNEISLAPGDVHVYQLAMVSSIAGGTGVELANMPADVSDLVATTAKAWKKGFGWCGDYWHTGGEFELDGGGDGSIKFAATGTHEDGISGGCCGCDFSYEIDPEPQEGTITLVDNNDCTGHIDFAGLPEGSYVVTMTVEDKCVPPDQSDQVVFVVTVPSGCFCGGASVIDPGPPLVLGTFGDITCDNQVNPVDVVKMVNFVYKAIDDRCPVHPITEPLPVTGGDWQCPTHVGDVTCDYQVNPVDVVRYVNYVYKNIVPFPCDPCIDL